MDIDRIMYILAILVVAVEIKAVIFLAWAWMDAARTDRRKRNGRN